MGEGSVRTFDIFLRILHGRGCISLLLVLMFGSGFCAHWLSCVWSVTVKVGEEEPMWSYSRGGCTVYGVHLIVYYSV